MSGDGSLNTLLKYRFSKRPGEKMNHSSSNDSSENGDGNGRTVNSNGDNGTSQPSAETSSPVFNQKFGQQETSGNVSRKNSSPWLSKSEGIATNGDQDAKSKKKFRRVRTYTTSDSDSETDCVVVTGLSQSPSPGEEGQGAQSSKAAEWEEKLRRMFPATTSMQVRAAVSAAVRGGNLEAGVDYLVQGHSAVKRSHPEDDDDSGDVPHNKSSYKRIRLMTDDSQDSVSTQILSQGQGESQGAGDTQRTESYSLSETQRTDSYTLSQSEETSIEFLRGAFPTLPRDRLRQVLLDCHSNADQAVIVLSSDIKEEESDTEAQASTTKGTRSRNNVKHEALSPSDEDADYDDENEDSDDSVDEDRNNSKQALILSFLDEATLAELLVLPGCSRKKAEVLVEVRPFRTWENLMETLQSSKSLSTSLIHGCYEIIQLRNVVVRLMKQCEQISSQMELVVSKLTGGLDGPKDEEDEITAQPNILNQDFELKPYQLIGLNWLSIMHSQQLNGILADEMGLGKTIQAIAFLAHLLEEGEHGPHVIIVPSSTIENWLRELSAWCPALGVIVYYGSQEERRATRHSIMYGGREDFHVLLTTYNMATGGVEDRSLFKKFQFHYAIFDEGHMLKNMSSLRFQNLMKISADRRLLLTGTPLQNNLLELMSLLCFVMPDIFQGKTEPLKKMFSMISRGDSDQKGKYEKERIAQAQRIMKPFILRRLKKDVLTQLPQKQEEVQYVPMLPEQQELYDGLVQRFSQEVAGAGFAPSGGVAMFMQLRKVANHPLLVRNHYDDHKLLQMATALSKEPSHRDRGALPNLIMEDMAQMNDFDLIGLCKQYKKHLGKFELEPSWIQESGKFRELDSLLPAFKQQDDRVLLFSQFTMMLDIVEVYLKQKDIRYLRLDGSTPVPERQQLIDQFNEDPEIFIFLLSTRAGGLGINLTAANVIVIHDIDFNPYNDKQAEDRCHRLGQKKVVKIYRMISKNTAEEAMLRCARAKLRLEQDVTTANDDADEGQPDVANLLREAISKFKNKGATNSSSTPSKSSTSTS